MYAYKPFINVSNEISSRKLLTKSFVNSFFRLIERKISNLNINRISISKLKSYSWYEILKQIKQSLRPHSNNRPLKITNVCSDDAYLTAIPADL